MKVLAPAALAFGIAIVAAAPASAQHVDVGPGGISVGGHADHDRDHHDHTVGQAPHDDHDHSSVRIDHGHDDSHHDDHHEDHHADHGHGDHHEPHD